ncbi:sulfatase-like hydrolase/transferase [Rubinisphaera italica]|uniref:Arylsulfatase n=1 Tax=Rubinisphaera italica TaxID=2527969 RepID=A0A5C5XS19_9PLAN|nr:sulfatase-like hydrolase/transferase [Rubinisphaera italica]TWT64532.1 Arylsulfatase [Rubinisphaera italica]
MFHQYILQAIILFAVVIPQLKFSRPVNAEQPTRPNIVMILADDQSYRDFGFMGNPLVKTPHLDQLAAESARFPNGYVPMSVCRPSLATLLTGLYPHQHGIHFNHPPPGLSRMREMTAQEYRKTRAKAEHLIREVPTLPRLLTESGYVSFQAGKHWEGGFKNAGFTHGMTTGLPADISDAIHGTREQKNGEWVAHGNGDAGLVIGRTTMQPVTDFIAENAESPFFLWYAPFLPHTPFDAPQEFYDCYADRNIPDYLLPYYAEIARFDNTVGQLMSCLDQHNLRKQTMIIFVSDNGFRPDASGKPKQDSRSKLSSDEDGLRTPILLNWPGVISPADYPQIVQTIDLTPTILAGVGLSSKVTPQMHGLNLLPAVTGEVGLPDRPAFGAIYPNDAEVLGDPAAHARGVWVRYENYKLILPGKGKQRLSPAFYDLRSDPEENQNLIHDAKYAQQQKQLSQLLKEWWHAGTQN